MHEAHEKLRELDYSGALKIGDQLKKMRYSGAFEIIALAYAARLCGH